MPDTFSQLQILLLDVILPNLKGVHASQLEQRRQTDRMMQELAEFRIEMQQRFAELRAEIAACRNELEDAMVTLRETDSVNTAESSPRSKKALIH
jgi:septal ring factor EnvC (AmiA/AmiB activator)